MDNHDWMTAATLRGDFRTMHVYVGDGNKDRQFEFNFQGGYIDRRDIKAFMVDAVTYEKIVLEPQFINTNTIKFERGVPSGWKVTVYRDTPKGVPIVEFMDGAIINAINLETATKQAVFSVAELFDRFDSVTLSQDEAITMAAQAKIAATNAAKDANTASDKAIQAGRDADDARKSASYASASAARAEQTADAAKRTAEGIDGKATQAQKDATDAVQAANTAKNTAEGVSAKADHAISVASAAEHRVGALEKALLNITSFTLDSTEEDRLTRAMQSLEAQGGDIYFPPGVYRFTGTARSNPNGHIRIVLAAGALLQQSVDADLINVDCQALGQFSVVGGGQINPTFNSKSSTAAAFRVNYGVFRAQGVSIWQSNYGGSFKYGFHLTDCQAYTRVEDVFVNDDEGALHTVGIGVFTNSRFSVDWTIRDVGAFGLDTLIQVKPRPTPTTTVEGIKVSECSAVGCNHGVVWDSEMYSPLLSISGCHINSHKECIYAKYVLELSINNSVLYRDGSDASLPFVQLTNCQDVSVLGGSMSNSNNLKLTFIRTSGVCAFFRVDSTRFANSSVASSIIKLGGSGKHIFIGDGCDIDDGAVLLDLSEYSGSSSEITTGERWHTIGLGTLSISGFSLTANQTKLIASTTVPGARASDFVSLSLANQDRGDISITAYMVGTTLRVYATASERGAANFPNSLAVYKVRRD